jgi:hypothetical protein
VSRLILYIMTLVLVFVLVCSAQANATMDARALLGELGSMLTTIPDSKEECQQLLRQIAAWQQKRLVELQVPQTKLTIAMPHDGDHVSEMPRIEGTAPTPNSTVWVIVHPLEVPDYWVQPIIIVRQNGTWNTVIHIGRAGRIDVGKHFEIMAVANPKVKLSEADVLSGWPEAELKSPLIELIRE